MNFKKIWSKKPNLFQQKIELRQISGTQILSPIKFNVLETFLIYSYSLILSSLYLYCFQH